MRHRGILIAHLILVLAASAWAQKKKTRDEQVREDQQKLSDNDDWIYNNYDRAVADAKASKKPMLVVFR